MSDASTPVVIAVDQGTSSTKTVAVDATGQIVASTGVAIGQENPRPGWIEQNPAEILASVLGSIDQVLAQYGPTDPRPTVAAIGLSNQRESALAWDTATGEPLGPLLGWQDRRTARMSRRLAARGLAETVRERSGLPLDPMFSALKFAWLLDEIDPDRTRARRGELTLGTVDAWLVQQLTGDRRIEVGNASRTQLLDVRTGTWDAELCDIFDIPSAALPPVLASGIPTSQLRNAPASLRGVRVNGVLGDSHAALFAHGVRGPGRVKVTYGTGSSVMGLAAGDVPADTGMAETIAWQIGTESVRAFEGNVLSIGSTLLWLAETLGCTTDDLDDLARSVPHNGGVYLVPAFAGLGAPWWDEGAAAVLTGFGPGVGRAYLARAAFESIPLQIEDVLEQADTVSGRRIEAVLTDGGPARNDWLMQRQADVSQRCVERSDVAELSVSGAAHLAGLSAGVWDEAALAALPRARTAFVPEADSGTDREEGAVPGGDAAHRAGVHGGATAVPDSAALRAGWARALARARMG